MFPRYTKGTCCDFFGFHVEMGIAHSSWKASCSEREGLGFIPAGAR